MCAAGGALMNVAALLAIALWCVLFFFSSRRRHTRLVSDWSSDVCSSDLSHSTVDVVAQWGETFRITPLGHHVDRAMAFVEQIERPCAIREDPAGVVCNDGMRFLQGPAYLQVGIQFVDQLHLQIMLRQFLLGNAQLIFVILAICDVSG